MIERKFMPLMPEVSGLIMYGLLILVLIALYYGIRFHFIRYGTSWKALWRTLAERIRNRQGILKEFIQFIILQKKTQATFPGTLVHSPIFYGFFLLLIGTALVAFDADILGYIGHFRILKGSFYLLFELVLDTAGLFFFFGILIAFFRRVLLRPAYLHSKPSDYVVLSLLLIIVASGFILESLRLKMTQVPYASFSYIGNFLAQNLFSNIEADSGLTIYRFLWFFHMVVSFSFIAIIPFTKFKHLLLIPINFLLYPPRSYSTKAKLNTPFNILEIEEDDDGSKESLDHVGVGSLEGFAWDERLQVDSCTNCGRCEDACPANKAGRLLSPRNIIQKLGTEIASADNGRPFFEEVILREEMWGCTHCYACMEVCPSFIRHVDHFLNFRRFIVNNEFDDEAKITLLGNIERNGNPYGLPSYARTEWLTDYDVLSASEKKSFEYLYFIGCSSSYDQRCQGITKSVIKILNAAEVDFAILGEEERCCGEPAKRIGEEGLFQMMAIENIELFNAYGVRKILVHCPHCYNMLKHEYKDFQGNFEVIHHSELILDLIESGKIRLEGGNRSQTITFHDPCNLGRLNGIYEQPRKILANFGNMKEMEHSRGKSFCCGGGGGNAFYQMENEKERISHIRLEEALRTGAGLIGLACPFCMIMFEDAKGVLSKDIEVPQPYDIAEIVSARLKEQQ